MNPGNLFENLSVSKAITAAWVFFVSVFFLLYLAYPMLERSKLEQASQAAYNNGYNTAFNQALSSFSGNVLQNGYNTALVQLAQALSAQYQGGCQEVVPVTVGTGSVGIMSVDCAQKIFQQTVAQSASGQARQ